MRKTKTGSVESLIISGELVVLDEVITKREGLGVKLAMPKVDFDALDMVKKTAAKSRGKGIAPLVNSVMWLIVRCQKTGVKANAVVALEAVGYPPLVMQVFPLNPDSKESVLVIQKRKVEVTGHA